MQLGKVVSTVRTMPRTTGEDDFNEGLEIGAADIPSAGYIRRPGRTVWIDSQEAEKNGQQFLWPLDIVLIVKGSVGKVGIVPPTVPPPGTGGWVAGQSAIVLRTNQNEVDPRSLAVQLRSPFGQELLQGIVSGASIPLIQQRELLRMEVLVPSPAIARQATEALEREEQLQDEIDRLREAQSEVAKNLWSQ